MTMGKAVLHAPELRSVGAHERIEAFAIGQLIVLGALRGVARFQLLEGHWGYSCGLQGYYLRKYPQMQTDVLAFRAIR